MLEKLPVGRSLRSEFALVHGEIVEPEAVAPANPFESGTARQEFGSRRIHDGREGTLESFYTDKAKFQDARHKRDQDVARQIIQKQAELIAVGLKGEVFDRHVVTLADGSRMALGDMRLALDVVNRDFDGAVEAAQAAGALRKDMTAAEIDVMRGRFSDRGAAFAEAHGTGRGLSVEHLDMTADEIALTRHAHDAVAARLNIGAGTQPPSAQLQLSEKASFNPGL